MAIIDRSMEFADATDITGTLGTINVGNVVDLTATRHVGRGQPVYLGVSIDTGVTAGAAGTLQFQLVADTTATISTSAPAEVLAKSPIFTTGTAGTAPLSAGKVVWSTALPVADGQAAARFMGVQAISATGTVTTGKVNAFLTIDPIAPWEAVPVANY